MCCNINAMGKVVCLMLTGLIVSAFPTNDCDGTCQEFPMEGVAQFSGTVPATGSVSIRGGSSCPPLIISNTPTPTTLESNDDIEFEENEQHSAYDDDHDYNKVPKEVVLGALLAGVITAVKGAEINATLADLDALVNTELGKIESLTETAVANPDASEIDCCVDYALSGIEPQINAECDVIDDFVDLELAEHENLVESTIENVNLVELDLELTDCLNDADDDQIKTDDSIEEEGFEELELEILETLVDSLLAKTESLLDLELDKVNEFVESELSKVDEIVKAELDKVNLLVESELAKTDAIVKSELAKVDSYVEAELAKVKISMEDIADLSSVLKVENCDYGEDEAESYEEPSINEEEYSYPVTGRTVISGRTECPPPTPTRQPLPLYVESFPVQSTDNCDSYEPESLAEEIYDDVTENPSDENITNVVKEPVFSAVTPAAGSCKITRVFPCERLLPLPNRDGVVSPSPMFGAFSNNMQNGESGLITSRMTILPAINLLRNRLTPDQGPSDVIADGTFEFCGPARAVGNVRLFNQFPCPPLPTKIGPDGKKYIWMAPPKKPEPSPKPSPSYPADFPDTVIMDSSKNHDKLNSEDLDVAFGLLEAELASTNL